MIYFIFQKNQIILIYLELVNQMMIGGQLDDKVSKDKSNDRSPKELVDDMNSINLSCPKGIGLR